MKHGQLPRLLERISNAIEAEGILRNCTTCFYWQDTSETCGLYKQRPPAKIIVNGCESYDEIPF
jgi:hypothetical protein